MFIFFSMSWDVVEAGRMSLSSEIWPFCCNCIWSEVCNNKPALGDVNSSLPLPLQNEGPPPIRPFSNQNNFSLLPERQNLAAQPGTSSTLGPEPGREPLSPETNGRLAPPVTKGAPQHRVPQPDPTSNSTSAPSVDQANVLHDHDYFRRPTATLDHDYFQQPPDVRPPPGFNYPPQNAGRPSRDKKLPTYLNQYQLYVLSLLS